MTGHVNSYYAASANPHVPWPRLEEGLTCDVCVVGGGYTGLSSALHLAERGYKVVLLEASRIGFGASGRNGGQIVNSFSRDIDTIERNCPPAQAKLLGSMLFEGSEIIRERIERYRIQCDHRVGGVFAADTERQLHELKAQQARWQRWGNERLELLDREGIRRVVQSDRYVGGLLDLSGGHLHPLNLALGEAEAIRSLGGLIFEQSPVTDLVAGEVVTVKSERGSVRARFVVVAGNAYLGNLVPELAAKSMPCGTQVLTTEVLGEARARELLPQNYCVEDCNYLLDYYRTSADHRLIYGGGVVYGARDPADIARLIMPKLLKTFPQLAGVRVEYSWTGNFLLTLSRLPQFGRIGSNIYYMQGYSGHGVTCTHLAGRLLAEALAGQAERFDAFANLPHYPFPGGRLLRVPLTAMGAVWYSLRDRLGI
ncbi:NAD(P)/FAD-dependent oxidoreductase [Aeromonas simiae]|uniref:NAD(P)/FAD-dependent oxidoreductase n=1 Tax=Aeromonas simiae TaxID=218936 RepID=UPI0005AB427A|nr:FAD-binding oxidoreductase [Aeromonas simiae]MDO2949641.1 FAD-binding oxidoreductase [Aeromonas simiae]MDO2957001.1 FAD-binding oxidoreductase [Aeromonas simiae]